MKQNILEQKECLSELFRNMDNYKTQTFYDFYHQNIILIPLYLQREKTSISNYNCPVSKTGFPGDRLCGQL